MVDIDVNEMSLDELKALQTKVNRAIETYEERRRKEARQAVDAKAREFGFTLNDLTGSAAKKAGGKRPPRYRHPDNPELTWSGRGRQPRWFKEAIEAGADPEDFRIK